MKPSLVALALLAAPALAEESGPGHVQVPLGAYEQLVRVADRAGDSETATAAQGILAEERAAAEKLYGELRETGLSVIYDDRDAGPGDKFADAELLGCPLRLTVGRRTLAAGEIEAQVRRGRETRTVPLDGAARAAAELWASLP